MSLALVHPQDRPLLHMIAQHEAALARTLGDIAGRWERDLAVPDNAEAKAHALIGAYLIRVADQAVVIQDRFWRKTERKDVQTFRAERIAWAREHGAALAVNLSDGVRNRVRSIIAAGAQAGLAPDKLRKLLQGEVPPLPGRTAKQRAVTIARTELHNAATFAQEHEALQLSRRGADLVKTWTATMDRRTRPWHRTANGQTRQMDQDFAVGGARMTRPGDPRGGAKNCINCRCVCRYIPRSYVAEDRQRRAVDMIRVAQASDSFAGRIAEMTAEMDPALAKIVRAQAEANPMWAASARALQAAADTAALSQESAN